MEICRQVLQSRTCERCAERGFISKKTTANKLSAAVAAAWIIVVSIYSMAAGQVVTVEPAKPRWGDQIKITYNPQAPGAKFRVDQEVSVRVSQSVIGASAPIEQRIKLVITGNMLMGETRVKENANHLQLNFIRSQGESDAGARQVLMVHRADGQPAHGAWLARANPKNYREAVTAELELYPDNYDAYFVKWRMASYAEPANLREIIETDIKQVAPKIQGEPASWLEALSFGYLQLK